MSLKGAWQGVSEVEICPIFLTILPRIGGEKNSPYSVTHGTPAIWVSSGGVGCQLYPPGTFPTVYQPQKTWFEGGRTPAFKRRMPHF